MEGRRIMYSRRDFLKAASLTGSAVVLNFHKMFGKPRGTGYFGLHEFVENNPDAVFILRTTVDAKTNAEAIKTAGHQIGQQLFVSKPDSTNAYPTATTNVAIKPNITSWSWDTVNGYTVEGTRGIQTDANFVEGVINSLGDLEVTSDKIYIREANYFGGQEIDGTWYYDLAQRSGVNLKDFQPVSQLAPSDIQWVDVPNGVWYKKIPYLWPVNSPASCLINISKFKSHSMGMTLCSKNVQGTNARPYVAHCTAWGTTMVGVDANHIVQDAFNSIKTKYDRHKAAGIARWDLPGGAGVQAGGLWMETHASRCLDNNSVLHPLINIIEGVYGREGPFVHGPGSDGKAIDQMTNVVIFGKNSRHVDIIGTYLAGHEPGNFGFFHLALERGLSKYLNPRDVPLYEWKLDGSATPTGLDRFTRTSIRTLYLQKAGEAQYHMVNEPYSYSGATAVDTTKYNKPDAFALTQNFPNPFNPSTSIQYYIPRSGDVRLEIFDIRGTLVDVLVDSHLAAGDHVTVWRSDRRPSGTYFYRLLYGGTSLTKSMVLLK
jgi:uncharacterized protein (DUF362 family)